MIPMLDTHALWVSFLENPTRFVTYLVGAIVVIVVALMLHRRTPVKYRLPLAICYLVSLLVFLYQPKLMSDLLSLAFLLGSPALILWLFFNRSTNKTDVRTQMTNSPNDKGNKVKNWLLPVLTVSVVLIVTGRITWMQGEMAAVHEKNCDRYKVMKHRVENSSDTMADSEINAGDQLLLSDLKEACEHAPPY